MFNKYYIFILAVMALLVLGHLLPASAQEYMVGEGDVLKITVYGHDDLSTVERVSGEGLIRFPLLGEVSVKGLSISEVSERIARGLSDGFIVSPQVRVFVEEFRSQKVIIMGEIAKPGLYELKGRISFLELVSMAGGLAEDAGDTATIKRKISKGSEQIISLDLKKLIEEGNTALDVEITDGDSIYIAKSGMFYVTGEVNKPAAYKYTDGTTVIKAITMAGGFTDKAAEGRIKIIRKEHGKEQTLTRVHMDEKVLPEDVIVVPESLF